MMWRRGTPILVALALITGLFAGTPAVASLGRHNTSGTPELGIAVTFGDVAPRSDSQEAAQAQAVFSYVQSLGANAVSINFPFYEASQSASTVSSGVGTPSPQIIGTLVRIARSYGLSVQLRPLLSEMGDDTTHTGEWRGSIVPANPAEWFQSYWTWLKPYVIVAKETGVSSFSLGAELNTLVTSTPTGHIISSAPTIGPHNFMPLWVPLVQQAQAILGDRFVYSASHLVYQTVPHIGFGLDAYTPVTLSAASTPTSTTPAATVASDFEPGIAKDFAVNAFAAPLSTTRLEEVGIAAVDGAWTQPNDFTYPSGTPLARWVQADWMTAMCNVFASEHMAGIYFWSISFNNFLPSYNADNGDSLYDWEGTATATAISNCFAQVRADT